MQSLNNNFNNFPFLVYVAVKYGETELDIEVEEDGTLLISSLQATWPTATGLSFVAENGRKRCVRVVNSKLFPPQGRWGDRIYDVIIQEEQSTCSGSSGPSGSIKKNSGSALQFNTTSGCQNVCVVRTKQSTLLVDGNALKLGPELAVRLL